MQALIKWKWMVDLIEDEESINHCFFTHSFTAFGL